MNSRKTQKKHLAAAYIGISPSAIYRIDTNAANDSDFNMISLLKSRSMGPRTRSTRRGKDD